MVVKPFIKAKDPAGADDPDIPSERVQDVESAFSIEPEKGVLKPSGTAEFTITFAPPEVGSWLRFFYVKRYIDCFFTSAHFQVPIK